MFMFFFMFMFMFSYAYAYAYVYENVYVCVHGCAMVCAALLIHAAPYASARKESCGALLTHPIFVRRAARRKLWVGLMVVTTVMTGWLSKEYGVMTVDWHMRAQRV